MRSTRTQKKYCFCQGSNDDHSFSKDDEHLFEMIRYFNQTKEEGTGELTTILRDMQGKVSALPSQRKQLIYHLAGCPSSYLEVLNRLFELTSSFKQYIWLWWGKEVVYHLRIRCVKFCPSGKKKKLRDFKELLLQIKKIETTYYPPYTYLRIREERGLIFDIMDSYEKLQVKEISFKLHNRLKEVRLFDIPVKNKDDGGGNRDAECFPDATPFTGRHLPVLSF